MFFSMLDQLSNDELAVINGEMEERLSALCALPDPQVSERCGVQLMTIHKSKGLGFDVVLVPGLERPTAGNKQELLLWLERATPHASSTDEPTEILIAPIKQKGSDDEPLLQWVKRQIAARDAEERKRLLYVACTRARRELHLFGAVEVEEEKGIRPPKSGTLLATAWPALEAEFQRQYATILSGNFEYPEMDQTGIETDEHLPGLRRLPSGFTVQPHKKNVSILATYELDQEQKPLFDRPEAGIRPRLFGTVVHELLERTAKQLCSHTLEEVRSALDRWKAEAVMQLRRSGLTIRESQSAAEEAILSIRQALDNPKSQWILMSHPEAASEAKWMGVIDDRIRTVQVDRVFRAGADVGSQEGDVWWIFDYKTTQTVSTSMQDFLNQQREIYGEQLATYARVLKFIHGETIRIHAGLYYPLLGELDWWPL
jgi:ATP-dependent helicase/nuclease subunit A